jgi:spore coat polysaccharide biosynthesis predicted glycosyltransferase SpsG
MDMTHLTLHANGGPSMGYGHLVRTSALATAWLNRGGSVEYVTSTPDPIRTVAPDAASVTAIEGPTRLPRRVEQSDSEVLVTDSYEVDHALQQELNAATQVYGAIIDRAPHPACCDVLVNGNLYAHTLDYEWTGMEPTWCIGPDYVLLRKHIGALTAEDPPWREHAERALVTMGGSDVNNLTPTIIQAFDGFDIHVDAIVGPGFSAEQETEIHTAAENVSADVTVTRDPDDLAERMFEVDFAVSTSSSTTYELLAMGTPIVSIPVADNQEPIATALCERDAATVLEREAGEDAFRGAIEEYVTNRTLRRKRRDRGCELVDGRGTERVYAELLSLLDER